MTNEDFSVEDMEEEDDDFEEDDEPWIFFGEEMYNAISPVVKKFLHDYFGDKMYNLQSETYIEIENSIREDFDFGDEIPEILFRHRTIKDPDKFNEALEQFIPPKTPFLWKTREKLFDSYLDEEDEEDEESGDSFLDYTDPEDLSEDQRKAKEIIDLADEILNEDRKYAHFMQSGYDIIVKEAQLFIEKQASFDLSILSPEGFEELQDLLDMLITMLLENLESIVNSE